MIAAAAGLGDPLALPWGVIHVRLAHLLAIFMFVVVSGNAAAVSAQGRSKLDKALSAAVDATSGGVKHQVIVRARAGQLLEPVARRREPLVVMEGRRPLRSRSPEPLAERAQERRAQGRRGSISREMSAARTEWVSAPIDTKSAPAPA